MTTRRPRIVLYDRKNESHVEETVCAAPLLNLLYGTRWGRLLSNLLVKRPFLTKLYGRIQRWPSSKKQIRRFVDEFHIDLDEVERPLDSFASFNEFFTRTLKSGSRPIDRNPARLISPADRRLSVFSLSKRTLLPVKGRSFTIDELVGDAKIAAEYQMGTAFIFRLAPSDYHRFCYIDDGSHNGIRMIGQFYHSVHPLCLENDIPVFSSNHREWTLLETTHFDRVLHVDVGALLVGKIVQHHRNAAKFNRGDEKGYFEFGGSTIILVFKPGVVVVDADVARESARGIETLVRYGSGVGTRAL